MTVLSDIDTAPMVRLKGEVRAQKSKRLGRKLSKLAQAVPAVVRSYDEQMHWNRIAARAVPILVERRQKMPGNAKGKRRANNLTLAIEKLNCPMFKIVYLDDPCRTPYFISANILSDYAREGIAVEVLAYPVLQKHGRYARVRKADIALEYVDAYASARANRHVMGMAQNAWRIAHIEGDAVGEQAAYHWLYHGTIKPCHDKDCPMRDRPWHDKRGDVELQSIVLQRMALGYAAEGMPISSGFHGSRTPHKARKPVFEPSVRPYAAETYGEMRKRLGMREIVFESEAN